MGHHPQILGALAVLGLGALAGMPVWAGGIPGRTLEEVTVTASRQGLQGQVQSASEGTVLAEQLEHRPLLRTGEALEVVPGLVVTQHSGEGKANQYFLRGFNLDHGTDFASRVEGMPVNMPTHAHGQGYSDINFMIPELIEPVDYKKGTYYADEGNFSAAGSVDITYRRALPQSLILVGAGEDRYGRVLLANSAQVLAGDLLLAADSTYDNGPWDLTESLRKTNGVVKYTHGDAGRGFTLEAMGYDGKWRSTDQIPLRAVQDRRIGLFGSIDPTDGGKSHRYTLSASWWGNLGIGRVRTLAYGIDYQIDLFSDFTYFTDPVHGDQFEQFDKRRVTGTDLRYTRPFELLKQPGEFSAGVQIRHDDVSPVGLYRTQARERMHTVRQDRVQQTSYSAYLSQSVNWKPWWRVEFGARIDEFNFRVDSSLALNSGRASDHIASPKLTTVFGPWQNTEYFINWGRGFHSNDARGTTIKVDPSDGVTPVDPVTPLVRAAGQEIGARTAIIPHVQLAASLWTLKLDSELLFSGDGGTTEPSRSSRRTGLETSVYYRPIESCIIDADLAWARARFTDHDPGGDRIPNAVERVASIGVVYQRTRGWFGGARLRYLGPAALIEDNSVRSRPTTLVNVDVGYHITAKLSTSVALLNVFNDRGNDITYYYASRLRDEAAPLNDLHFHPVEPRALRVGLRLEL